MKMTKGIGVLLLVLFILLNTSTSVNGRNWIKFFRSMAFVRRQMLIQKPIGYVKHLPRAYTVEMDNMQVIPNPRQLINPATNGAAEADIVFGKGMALYSHQAEIYVNHKNVKKMKNICGLVLTSLNGFNSAFVDRMRMFWKSGNLPWDLLVNRKNGEDVFYPRLRPGKNSRVILFDSVPATSFRLLIIGTAGKNLNLKMAFLSGCLYPKKIVIKKCGEMIDRNPKFASQPPGVPISIKCPIDCIRTWPCWGFKVYSTDTPICWAATQNFGRFGDGTYTLYKIPGVVMFRSEIDPALNHGIYCRRSIVHYPGFTFDRKYFDIVRKEYRDYMGA